TEVIRQLMTVPPSASGIMTKSSKNNAKLERKKEKLENLRRKKKEELENATGEEKVGIKKDIKLIDKSIRDIELTLMGITSSDSSSSFGFGRNSLQPNRRKRSNKRLRHKILISKIKMLGK